jgi:hypothetical protein
MRNTKTWLIAGLAGAAIVGLAGVAAAKDPLHTLRVALPDGAVAVIRYAGATPPRVSVSSAPIEMSNWAPAWFAPEPAFIALDRVAAEMNREAALMLQPAESAPLTPGVDVQQIGVVPLRAGSESYSVASTVNGADVCGKSVEITSTGRGRAPHVVTRTWGHCGSAAAPAPGADSVMAAPAPTPSPGDVALYRTAYDQR